MLPSPVRLICDGGVDEVAAQRPQARKDAVLVGAGKPGEADDVSRQNRSEFPSFGHPALHAPDAV